MLILDTSEIQARKPNPQAREVSRLTWKAASIPQNAIPFTARRQALRARVRRVHRRARPAPATQRGRRGADHRHLRRARAARDLQPAPAGQPARRPRGGERRPGRRQPGAGLRGALLQHPDARSTRRSSPARSSPPGLRVFDITRPAQAEGDRLLRRARPSRARRTATRRATSRCPSRRSSPTRREVWFSDGADRLLRRCGSTRASGPGRRRRRGAGSGPAARLPVAQAPIGRRGIGRVRLGHDAQGARAPAARPAAQDQRVVALVREGRQGHGRRGVLEVRPRGARRPPARRHAARATAAPLPAPPGARPLARAHRHGLVAHLRRPRRQGPLRRGRRPAHARARRSGCARYLRAAGVRAR